MGDPAACDLEAGQGTVDLASEAYLVSASGQRREQSGPDRAVCDVAGKHAHVCSVPYAPVGSYLHLLPAAGGLRRHDGRPDVPTGVYDYAANLALVGRALPCNPPVPLHQHFIRYRTISWMCCRRSFSNPCDTPKTMTSSPDSTKPPAHSSLRNPGGCTARADYLSSFERFDQSVISKVAWLGSGSGKDVTSSAT